MLTLVKFGPRPARWSEAVHVPRERWRFSEEGSDVAVRGGRVGSLATALVVLAVAVACSGTPDDSPTPTPTSPSPTSSSTPTPTSDTEAAAANAEALVREYYRVIDELGADPSKPLTELDAIASGDEVEIWREEFDRERHDGWRQVGETRIADLTVQSVNLDNADPSAGRVPTVQVDVCFDVSDVDVVDGSGTSVITADRPGTGWVRHTVSNSSWDTDPESGWRVSTSVDLEQPSCDTAD